MHQIPFNKPSAVGAELHYMADAVSRGHISGNGFYTNLSESYLSRFFRSPSILTTSCTHALEMSSQLLSLEAGDEIIMPSYTFVSTANSVVLSGAKPVFADINLENLNIDISSAEKQITEKTKAIVIVHYGGVGANPDAFKELCDSYGLKLIEDNAHGFGGKYKNKYLGTFGDFATLSFHETKNIICGEGGALILNNSSFLERAKVLRDKGTNRSKFLDGQIDKYTWIDVGSSWVISDLLAAFLYGQFENFELIQRVRGRIWEEYQNGLSNWADINGVVVPRIPKFAEHTSHLFYLRFLNKLQRDRFISHMKANGIYTPFHYQALHETPFAKKFSPNYCPNSSIVSETLVRLPIYFALKESEQEYIIEKVKSFRLD